MNNVAIVCPECKGELGKRDCYLICKYCEVEYPIVDDIALMVSNFENETCRDL